MLFNFVKTLLSTKVLSYNNDVIVCTRTSEYKGCIEVSLPIPGRGY